MTSRSRSSSPIWRPPLREGPSHRATRSSCRWPSACTQRCVLHGQLPSGRPAGLGRGNGNDTSRTTPCGRMAYGVERSQCSATRLCGERSRVNALMPSRSVDVQASMQRGTILLMRDSFTRRSRRARRSPTPRGASKRWRALDTMGVCVLQWIPAVGASERLRCSRDCRWRMILRVFDLSERCAFSRAT